MSTHEFEIVEDAVKEILKEIEGEITDVAFYYDTVEQRYLILHNFFDRLFSDDEFADRISVLLYENLDSRGVTNYDFYEDERALAQLTMSFKTKQPQKEKRDLFSSSIKNDFSIRMETNDFTVFGFRDDFLLSA